MEQNNDSLGLEDIVFMLLETLKSNGTFDEIRRHCVSNIDAKPTYQNWKQRIESNVLHFLNKFKFTPELNKNAIRESLRKHLLDGHETQDIEEGADRILTQLLAPRAISIFEPKISVAVNEYLGIKNEAPPVELNGLKESSMNLIKVPNVEINAVFNPKIDFIPDANNVACDKTQKGDRKDLRSDKKEKSSSLCKEFKSLNGSRSDDENDAGGSTKPKNSQHKNKTSTSDKSKSSSTNHKSSKKDNSCKEIVEKSKDVINKPKDIINKSNDFVDKSKDVIYGLKDIIDKSKDIVNKSKDIDDKAKDVSKSKDLIDKSKDIVNKPKDIVDKSKDIVNKPKDIVDKSKDIVYKPKDIVDKSKDIVNKPKDIVDKSSKDIVYKPKDIVDKSKDIVNKPKDIVDKSSKDIINKPKDIVDKSKDIVNKPKDIVDKSKDIVNKPKDIVDKSKDIVNKPKDIVDKSKDIVNKPKDIVDKSKDKSFLSKNSYSNSSSHKSNRTDTKRTKRSLEEKKKSSSLCKEPKLLNGNRSDDESNSGGSSKQKSTIHKNKSSSDKTKSSSSNHKSSRRDNSTDVVDKSKDKSLSKNSSSTDIVDKFKDKSLSKISNKTVDKSKEKSLSKNYTSTDINKTKKRSLSKNSTSTDIDKSKKKSLSKNSSCIDILDKSKNKSLLKSSNSTFETDKSKIKSSLLKNARCIDVVDKSKEKSLSKNSSSSSHKSNRTDTKMLKLSHSENNKLPTNKVTIKEKKPEKSEWNDFRSSIITNDEQDAANVLLSMSAISYESSHTEIITENIIFIENSSPITETLITPKTENELEVNENSDQTKILPSSDNENIKENSQLKSNNLETRQSQNSIKNLSNMRHLFEKVCSVEIERLQCIEDIKPQHSSINNVKTTEEHQKPTKIGDEKEFKISNVEMNVDPSENEKTNEYNSNDILKVPKLKLKILPNKIDSINKSKRKKNHKDKQSKKLKLSKSFDIPSEVSVSVIDSVSTNIICRKIDQKSIDDTDVRMNDSGNTITNQLLHKEIENISEKVLDDDESFNSFKGFSDADAIPCKNYELLKNVIKTLQIEINNLDKIDDGFKGFNISETHICKHRDIIYAELMKLKENKSSTDFLGFPEDNSPYLSIGHKYVIKQYELAKKQNNVDNHHQNVKSGGNGIQKGKTLNEVISAYLYKSNNDAPSKEIYNKPINDKKKDCPAVNNNNHNHDNWVVEQEMKYKLLPVKVKLERLMEFGSCTNTKRVSDSSKDQKEVYLFERHNQQTEL